MIVTVVVPTYNERANLPGLLDDLRAVRTQLPMTIWIVDDASADGTVEFVRDLARTDSGLRLVEHGDRRGGRGRAVIDAMRLWLEGAPGDAVLVEMDGDRSHDPAAIPEMLRCLESTGADVVLGSRYVPGGGASLTPARRGLSILANLFARRILGLAPRDCSTGFRVYRHAALDGVGLERLTTRGHATHIELLYRLCASGARVAESPIHYAARGSGRSKADLREVARTLRQLIGLRWSRPADRARREGQPSGVLRSR